MNSLIKKEIRLLLPAWVVAMVLAILPLPPVVPGSLVDIFNFGAPLPFVLGILLLAIAPFGQEISSGSFGALLSQPIERRRIWAVKMNVLACAFLFVLFAWTFLRLHHEIWPAFPRYEDPFYYLYSITTDFGNLVLLAIVIFSGGLWATLLLRQIVGAFALALLTPLVIDFFVGLLSYRFNWPVEVNEWIFVGYSVAGFFFARWLFLHAQDTQWTGGDFSFPWHAKISGQKAVHISKPPRHRFGALVGKEIFLHQANLLIAVLILALHLSSLIIRKIHPHFRDPNAQFILESVWGLWLLMPLLIGSAAVAEERKLGAIESQLCLPVSRRFQLVVKFFTSLGLSLFLGAAVPGLIEGLGSAVTPVFLVAALVFLISFYGSSLARTTIQAIGLALLIFTLLYFYESGMTIHIFSYDRTFDYYPHIGLIYLKWILSLPVLLAVSAWLTFWNFKWLHQTRKLWARNIIVLLITLASLSALSRSIYFRAWELFMSADPAHGPARLGASALPVFSGADNGISALLPDGRLWTAQIQSYDVDNHGTTHYFPIHQRFLDGSNWISAAWSYTSLAAIKSDGTLFKNNAGRLIQVGSDTNWLQIAGEHRSSGFLLLKNDGTVWYWGSPGYFRTFPIPTRISNGTNFTDVLTRLWGPIARKNDGTWWAIGLKNTRTNLTFRMFPVREASDVNQQIVAPFGLIELSTNGDLSYSSELALDERYKLKAVRNVSIGQNAKWIAAATGGAMNPGMAFRDSLFTIRSDGTLWEWIWSPPGSRFEADRWAQDIRPVQLGNHSDWVALFKFSSYGNGPALALAADGSLWAWDQPSDTIWLAPSHRPQYMGNIFEGAPRRAVKSSSSSFSSSSSTQEARAVVHFVHGCPF